MTFLLPMTPEDRAKATLDRAREGPIVDVCPARTERFIAEAIREAESAVAKTLFEEFEAYYSILQNIVDIRRWLKARAAGKEWPTT